MRKIIIISTFYDKKSGISNFVKNLEIEFDKKNDVNLLIISPDREGEIWPKSRLLITLKAWRIISKVEPTEIHCHCAWYLQLPALLFSFTNKQNTKIFAFKHSDVDLKRRSGIYGTLHRYLDKSSTKVFFISKYLKSRWASNISNSYSSALSVRTGVGDQSNRVDVEKDNSITYVGLFEYSGKVRGLELLIDSFRQYINTTNDNETVLKIIGRGKLRHRVELKVKENDLTSRVVILDNVDDPSQFYIKSKLHCHITFQDAMPTTILESLSLGTQVLASDECGIPEINAKGMHLTKNSVESVAEGIRMAIAYKGPVELSDQHCWTNVANEILELTAGSFNC
ncbi:glycosyltransferase [Stutzerimonas xanthomarina]|uniref:glycosyltransferase n=1 Tax=Stutzerimonas xanthomarina TaxID=271420 RepID=UPI003AA893AB